MVSSDFRLEARRKLSGKWGKAACIALAYFAVSYVINLLLNNTSGFANDIITILDLVIEIPLSFGLVACFIKLFNEEDIKAFSFFSYGFDNFGKSWGIALRTLLKLLLPLVLLVVSVILVSYSMVSAMGASLFTQTSNNSFSLMTFFGLILFFVSLIWLIVKSYYYELTYMIAVENPEMSSEDVVEKSKELMTNNRAKMFFLELSFFGWAFLAGLTLGIGMLWLVPYMQVAKISFYKHLIAE